MYQLILKDILLQKKRLIYFPLIYNIFVITVFQDSAAAFVVAGIVIAYMMVQTAAVYEDMNNSEVVINSLPVKKEIIVLARYLSVFVYVAVSIITYGLVSFVVIKLQLPFVVQPVTLTGITSIIMGLGVLLSVYFPVFFKYGYIKAKLFHIFFMILAFSLPTVIINIVQKNPDDRFVKSIMNFFQSLSAGEINIMVLLITLVIMALSYVTSVMFYKKREF